MTVKQAEEQVGTLAREVVLKRAAISTVVAFGLNLAVAKGWIVPNVQHGAQEWVNRGFDYAAFIAGAFYIRKGVTPADPKLNPTLQDGSAAVAADAVAAAMPVIVQHIYPAPEAVEAPPEAVEAPVEDPEADAAPEAVEEDTSDVDPALAGAVAVEVTAAPVDAAPVAAPVIP